jgi:putative ABC transport system permease protein
MREQGNEYGYFAVPILDLHLQSAGIDMSFKPPSDITYVYIFSVIGFFLILIACVNFMNLYTASASSRAKEVGLRKTLGAERNGMMAQFLLESILYVLLAAVLSLFLIYLILPWFNSLSGKMLTLQIFAEPWFLGTMFGLIVMIGLIAGSYPAFYLTAFSPVEVLKGRVRRGAQSSGFRSTLVVGQFFISIGLIACTILVNQQLQFMQNKNLGFNKEQSIVLTNTSRLDNNREPFKEELLSDTRVLAASYTTFTIPGTQNVTVFQRPETDSDYIMATYYADHDHQDALGFEMAEGRYFSEDFPTDSSAIVINETAVQELGMEDPVGKEIIFPGNDNRTYDVIGVMQDFNFESLRNEIMPLAIVLTETANEMIVRFQSEDPREAVNMITSTWDEYSGGEPVDYTFLDDDFDELFREEQRLGAVFTAFTIIAIFIACLGLLGLSAYMAERRTQEIGIRKVLGATVPNILGLLSVEFLKLLGIAFLLAIPISWYFIQNWLQGFAYRTEISPMVFVFTALATIGIVLVTISWQTLKAAFMNPVRSIKTE